MYAGHLYDVLGIQNIDDDEKKLERNSSRVRNLWKKRFLERTKTVM
jgi:hypothetical protein